MHDMMTLTYLYAAGIEPRPWLRPPPARRRRHRARTRAALGWLLLVVGGVLQRGGSRLSGAAVTMAATAKAT
jgi:hypothetical protein